MKDTNWHRSRRSTKECEWKQGESAEGKKKTSSEKGRGGKAVAPPVGRRSGGRPAKDFRLTRAALSWKSGESQPQLRISKEGDLYLRQLLVQGAHCILWRGPDTDLKRWGLKLAARGGKNAKKRAVVAVARKLAVLLHRLWVTGEVYEPLRNSQAQQEKGRAA